MELTSVSLEMSTARDIVGLFYATSTDHMATDIASS